ncbi:MAG: protein-glutamate O-methyltransferase CheR, partial [Planctomycetota bacterium]|nr:protein-glutamate O-methyltransferase CheR [Planctomycetota bacterium]
HRGFYGKDRVEGIKPPLVGKYFTPARIDGGKDGYQVRDELRRLVSFRHLNLFSDWPFKHKFNFIFCRNVMIYFDRPTQEELVNRYCDNLVPGGYLFIGHSESLSGIKHGFEYVKPTIYRKPG